MCHPHENTSRAPGSAWARTAWAVPGEYSCTPRGTSTTSAPSEHATARFMTSGSSVAPGTMLIRPSNSASLPTLLSRHTATASYPRSSACWTMYLPSFPDAPTTQILMTRLDSSQFRAIEPARTTSSRNPPSESTQGKVGAVRTDADAVQLASPRGAHLRFGREAPVQWPDLPDIRTR